MASHKQLKVSVESDLAESFKAACINTGVSMAAEISAFMAARTGAVPRTAVIVNRQDRYNTRAKRRYHIGKILIQLKDILDYEDAYRSNIPVNLQSGQAYENAEQAIDSLEQAIELLNDAY